MPERAPFEYVVIRVMPRVDRGEYVNAGVILICRPKRFLCARVALDPARLLALDPTLARETIDAIERQLGHLAVVASGDRSAGSLAQLEMGERWHLLSAPSSTVVQPSPVHTGLCLDPAAELDALFADLVLVARPGGAVNATAGA